MKKIIVFTLLFAFALPLMADENNDWITEYRWQLFSRLFDCNEPYYVYFYKLKIPSGSTLYQQRLRKVRFGLFYQTNDKNKLYMLEESRYKDVFDMEFDNNYSRLLLKKPEAPRSTRQERVDQQVNPKYPLLGIWGELPNLTEYRIIDPADCIYYMEICEQISGTVLRAGTYLLKQTGDKTLETVSSFSDGQLKLEILNENRITLTPLFSLPDDEKGVLSLFDILRPLKLKNQ